MKRNIVNYIKEYGISLFITKGIRRLYLKSNSVLATKINAYNEDKVTQALSSIVLNKEFKKSNFFKKKQSLNSEPIWIMWWQGYDQAPKIVKACINSIRRNNVNHEVILITKDNFQDYVNLPTFVLNKVDLGCISITHLSDMIRALLLYIYGGVWCDATILDIQPIPDEVFKSNFYTIRTDLKTKDPSHGNWTTFFMSSRPRNILMKKIAIYHFQFWKEYNEIIDYIMFDYIIKIISQNDEYARRQIETVPKNNSQTFELRKYINKPYNDELKNKIKTFEQNTYLFKLSWKDQFIKNDNSLYHHILNKYL